MPTTQFRQPDAQKASRLANQLISVLIGSGERDPEILVASAEVLARLGIAQLRSSQTQAEFDKVKESLGGVLKELHRVLDEEWFLGGKEVAVA